MRIVKAVVGAVLGAGAGYLLYRLNLCAGGG